MVVNSDFLWQELIQKRSEELAITEKSIGLVMTLKSDFSKPKELTTKKILEYFGWILQVEIGSEQVLFVHGNRIGINPALVNKTNIGKAVFEAKKGLI